MKTPRVSILTTVFNREKYIAECIESVLNSSYQDWEMIIVDDCSTDNSLNIARHYEAKESRIKVCVNEKNLGDYPNRNKAASYAKGKYIKYLDADDMIYPHGLETMVDTMEKFPECALGISQEVAEDYLPYPFQLSPKETYTREFLKRGVLRLGPTGTIVRREVFEERGGFTGTRFIGDTEMWYKIAMKYPVVKMVPGLTFWRRHEGQEIALGNKSNFYIINDYKLKINTLTDTDIPLNTEDKTLAIKKVKKAFLRNLIRIILKEGRIKKSIQIAKQAGFKLSDMLQTLSTSK